MIKGGYKNKCDCLVFGNILVFVMYNIIWYEYKVLNSKLIIIYLGIFNIKRSIGIFMYLSFL